MALTIHTAPLLRDRVQIARFRLRVMTGPDAPRAIESAGVRGHDRQRPGSGSPAHRSVRVAPPLRDPGQRRRPDLRGSRQHQRDAGRRSSRHQRGDRTGRYDHRRTDRADGRAPRRHDQRAAVMRRPLRPRPRAQPAMRRVFALLERVASSEATVLHRRRDRHRQERDRRGDPRGRTQSRQAVRGRRLRSAAAPPARVGAVRSRARRVHRCHRDPASACSSRHPVAPSCSTRSASCRIDLQPKLLRALERRTIRRVGSNRELPVDVRLIAATHRDLRRAINQRTFRSDLWYRINTVRVVIPPLRERRDDIPMLVMSFYREHARRSRRGAAARAGARDDVLARGTATSASCAARSSAR